MEIIHLFSDVKIMCKTKTKTIIQILTFLLSYLNQINLEIISIPEINQVFLDNVLHINQQYYH